MTLTEFAEETASESPAPGGGSISAYCGALGAALGTMVANLSSHKRGWDDRWEEFSQWAVMGQLYTQKLLGLVDEDTNAFNKIMEAFRLPKGTDDEKAARTRAIGDATKYVAKKHPANLWTSCLGGEHTSERPASVRDSETLHAEGSESETTRSLHGQDVRGSLERRKDQTDP